MYTVEFETRITGQYIRLKDFEKLANKQARIIVIVDEESGHENTLAAFDRMTQERGRKPQINQDLNVEGMEDDINSDLF